MSPSRYPVCSGPVLVKALTKLGYLKVSQRGSHVKLKKNYEGTIHTIVVPLHKELDRGTFGSIMKRLRVYISEDEVLALLRK